MGNTKLQNKMGELRLMNFIEHANKSIAELLYENEIISNSILHNIKKYSEQWGINEYEALLDTHILTAQMLADKISEILQIDRIYDISNVEVNYEELFKLSFNEWFEIIAFPLIYKQNEENTTLIVMQNPLDKNNINKLKKIFSHNFKIAISTKDIILNALYKFYPISEIINDDDNN